MKKLILTAMLAAACAASAENHIAFVNVGGAVEESLFADAVTNKLVSLIKIYAVVDRADAINIPDLIGKASMGYPKTERQLSVYFVDSKDLPPQVTVPSYFAVINVRGLKKDADAKKYAMRIKKMVLKGLAFACGFGANQDVGRCVMAVGSFESLQGIDATSASYSPFCYFPLQDYLSVRGLLDVRPVEF